MPRVALFCLGAAGAIGLATAHNLATGELVLTTANAGQNFYIGQHLVLKADYQWFQENTNFTRFDLGLGVAF